VAALSCSAFQASHEATPSDNNPEPATRPTTLSAAVSKDVPISIDTVNAGDTKSATPIPTSSAAVTMNSNLVFKIDYSARL
jgi:hypothetical protein